jgi:hypothetical protein
MNSHIASTSLLGLDSIHKNNYEEIDERLLNTFISEPKSTFSEDEESSDSSNKAPSIVNVRKANKQCPVSSRKKCKFFFVWGIKNARGVYVYFFC